MKSVLGLSLLLAVLLVTPGFASEMDALNDGAENTVASGEAAASSTESGGEATEALSSAPEAAAAQPAAEAAPASSERRKPVKIEEGSVLPLRVLTRPMSTLFKDADENSAVVQGNLPAFLPYYVYTRPGGEDRALEVGWYEVGSDNRGTIVGWLRTADIFEWKQTMCLTYTHPENRKPVLMFDSDEALTAMLDKGSEERIAAVQELYATIDSGNVPPEFPVISVEPKTAVDFSRQFYLLPILSHKQISLEGREGRLLELAAVSGEGEGARDKTDIRENRDYVADANITSADAAKASQKDLAIDIVWAVDTTRSMGPYIDKTRDVVSSVSRQLASEQELKERIRFGVWGYRDPVEAIPAIEYTTKNFTEQLLSVDEFLPIISSVKETKVDSVDFPEDMFSGLADAITQTQWTPGAMRFIVLVGDAPGHELGHKWNISGYDEVTLRSLATENNVTIFSIQVRPKGAQKHQKKAESQFRAIATNAGSTDAAYYSVQGSDHESFALATQKISATLAGVTKAAISGNLGAVLEKDTLPVTADVEDLSELDAASQETADKTDEISKSDAAVGQAIKAALVQWVGSEKGAKPPRDVIAWVTDKDLTNPNTQSLEVRLLISKQQLDSLATLLGDIIKAGRTGQVSGDDFFSSLKAASAVASRDPNMLKNATSLANSGLIPDFLAGLPYHSRLMSMSNELWNSWSPDEQDSFLNELDARIKAYKALHDSPEGWVKLNEGADADDSVYPVPLDMLP